MTHGASSELHLFRSASVRELCSYGVSSEKRRSTSFDETLGELATVCASIRAGADAHADANATLQPIKKKASFWQGRIWKFARGKKGALGSKETLPLPVVPEKEESTVPKLKKFLHKLRLSAKDGHKPAICSSGLDLQVVSHDESAISKGEGKSKAPGNQAERLQRLYSVHPEPIATSQQSSTTAPIWERRNATQPSTLDLSNLRVTGLKHLQRPHQYRG